MEKDRLYELIGLAYTNEVRMEQMGLWEAHLSSHRKLRDAVLRLSEDSTEHRKALEGIMASLRDFKTPSSEDITPPGGIDLEDLGEMEIAIRLKSVEDRMLSTYQTIRSGIDIHTLKPFYLGERPGDMIQEIDRILGQEKGHQKILEDFIGNYREPRYLEPME